MVITTIMTTALASCNVTRAPQNPTEDFDEEIRIKPEKIIDSESLGILFPAYLHLHDGWIVTQDFAKGAKQICFVSMGYDKVIRGIDVGRGPDEMSAAGRLGADDDGVYLYDNNMHRVFTLEICDDTLRITDKRDFDNYGGTPVTYDRNHVLQTTFTDSLLMKLSANDGEVISCIDYPKKDGLDGYNHLGKNSIYCNSTIAVSPDRKHFAIAPFHIGLYIFGDIENERLHTSQERHYYDMKIADSRYESDFIVPSHDSKINSFYSFGTERHAVFLYSGDPNSKNPFSGKDILIFGWDGEPVAHLKSEYDLNSICYDESRKIIIAIGFAPEPSILEFDMKDIIKTYDIDI